MTCYCVYITVHSEQDCDLIQVARCLSLFLIVLSSPSPLSLPFCPTLLLFPLLYGFSLFPFRLSSLPSLHCNSILNKRINYPLSSYLLPLFFPTFFFSLSLFFPFLSFSLLSPLSSLLPSPPSPLASPHPPLLSPPLTLLFRFEPPCLPQQ